jgi:DNA-binding CsgD family transcriptional regulator
MVLTVVAMSFTSPALETTTSLASQILSGRIPAPDVSAVPGASAVVLAVSSPFGQQGPIGTDLLELVCQRCTNKEIAQQLMISEYTVKNHLSKILSKLHLRSRAEAARYAAGQRRRPSDS